MLRLALALSGSLWQSGSLCLCGWPELPYYPKPRSRLPGWSMVGGRWSMVDADMDMDMDVDVDVTTAGPCRAIIGSGGGAHLW